MAKLLTAATMAMVAGAIVLLVVGRDAAYPDGAWGARGTTIVLPLVISPVGYLVASRRASNPIGWLLLVGGFLFAIAMVTVEWATNALGGGVDLPGGRYAAWWTAWGWVPSTFLVGVHATLLFPDGHYASRRWKWVGVAGAVVGVIVTAVNAFADGPVQGYTFDTPVPHLAISPDDASSLYGLMTVMLVLGQVSLIRRVRRVTGDEREQLRWVLFAVASLVVTLLLAFLAEYGLRDGAPTWVTTAVESLVPLAVTGIPVATGIAILKYRLYDIDVVISRALVVAGLIGFGTVAYLAIVIGLGEVLGTRDSGGGALSIAATALIAVGFQPVRTRLERFARRFVYGDRATPYEVLADIAQASAADPDALLDRLAALVRAATAAERVAVWLRVRDELRVEASSPSRLGLAPVAAIERLDATSVVPVRHEGELLGAITVDVRRGETLDEDGERLVRDVAAQAGVALRNVRLTAELVQRVEELRESRQRLVTAQDEERRRLERDLHDGAQQQLVALRVRLGLARSIAESGDVETTATQLGELSSALGEAIDTLRDLAHGIYPPRLAADGLVGALRSEAAKSHLPVQVSGDIARYDKDVEAAVYFCCLEALQNAAKYATPSRVDIELEHDDKHLAFRVRDDGCGFDPDVVPPGAGTHNMRDRIDALGGTVSIVTRPGEGTTVEGRLPVVPADLAGVGGG